METVGEDVGRAVTGDPNAFGRLVKQHQPMVAAIAYAITGDLALSEDIAQEVFLTAWRRLGNLREPARLGAWLAAITRNLARNALRRRGHDPLHAAESLDAKPVALLEAAPAATRLDRERVTWQALAQLPELYREPLVLFYRENQSTRQVAQLLTISEECARQRLTRGREMLKDRVALVEKTVDETRPGDALTLAVMAALPLPVVPGALTGVAVAAAKGGAAAKGIGGMSAIVSSLAGPVIGMTGGFFGMWAAIRNSGTLLQRRYALRSSARMYALLHVFLGYQCLCGATLWGNSIRLLAFSLGGWAVYLVLLAAFIVSGHRRARFLAANDDVLRAAEPLEESELSLRRLWWNFAGALGLAIGGALCMIAWGRSLPGAGFAMGVAIAILELAAAITFYVLFKKGIDLARDDVVFLETAPEPETTPLTLPSLAQRETRCPAIGGFAGGQLGGALWLAIDLFSRGDYGWCAACSVAALAIFGGGTWLLMRRPKLAAYIVSAAMGLTGLLLAAVLLASPPEWIDRLPAHVQVSWRLGVGAAVLGLYWTIGAVAVVRHRRVL
ncbi:MAG: sigma-70 family RNA polymerase sigma factor [Lentisphaeria bacterium]